MLLRTYKEKVTVVHTLCKSRKPSKETGVNNVKVRHLGPKKLWKIKFPKLDIFNFCIVSRQMSHDFIAYLLFH